MRYAKLINGYPQYAPASIAVGGMTVANPTGEMLLSAGYLPVVTSEPPQTDDLHYPVSVWAEQGGQIVQVWSVEEIPTEDRPADLEARVTNVENELSKIRTAYEEGVNNA